MCVPIILDNPSPITSILILPTPLPCTHATRLSMLDDLEEDMDAAHAKMNFVMGKIGKLLKTKSAFNFIWPTL